MELFSKWCDGVVSRQPSLSIDAELMKPIREDEEKRRGIQTICSNKQHDDRDVLVRPNIESRKKILCSTISSKTRQQRYLLGIYYAKCYGREGEEEVAGQKYEKKRWCGKKLKRLKGETRK